jgi:hypothetical protein
MERAEDDGRSGHVHATPGWRRWARGKRRRPGLSPGRAQDVVVVLAQADPVRVGVGRPSGCHVTGGLTAYLQTGLPLAPPKNARRRPARSTPRRIFGRSDTPPNPANRVRSTWIKIWIGRSRSPTKRSLRLRAAASLTTVKASSRRLRLLVGCAIAHPAVRASCCCSSPSAWLGKLQCRRSLASKKTGQVSLTWPQG